MIIVTIWKAFKKFFIKKKGLEAFQWSGPHTRSLISIKLPPTLLAHFNTSHKQNPPFLFLFFVFVFFLLLSPLFFLTLSTSQELANPSKDLEDAEANKGLVVSLYEALNSRDVDAVHSLLAPDLEWWFHGPPSHQFLMQLLTGTDSCESQPFIFAPQSITALGSVVLAEGCGHSRSIAWVHAWTVVDGIITQVREYFNTSVTVTRLGSHTPGTPKSSEIVSSASGSGPGSHYHCQPVWESRLSNQVGKSVPGLVLAL